MTLTLNQPWSNIGTAHRLIILDMCAKLFVNPTRGLKDIERTRKHDEQTDGKTDNGAKNNTTPHFMGEDIIMIISLNYFFNSKVIRSRLLT